MEKTKSYFVKIDFADWIEAKTEQEAKEKVLQIIDDSVEVLSEK
jgi:hypothetical protein